MFQHEPQQTSPELNTLNTHTVGAWLRTAANYFNTLANQFDRGSHSDSELEQLLPPDSPLRTSDCAVELIADAKNIIDKCRYDGADPAATRTELARILAIPPFSIEVGPLLRETLPELLRQTPRGQSFAMLEAVRTLAEQFSQNRDGSSDIGRFNLLLSGLERTLGPRFSAEVLLDYSEVIKHMPALENERRSFYHNALARYFADVFNPDESIAVLDDLKRIATHLGKTNQDIPSHVEYCATSMFLLLPYNTSMGAEASIRFINIVSGMCDVLEMRATELDETLEQTRGKQIIELVADTDGSITDFNEVPREALEDMLENVQPLSVAMLTATFALNAWQRAGEIARLGNVFQRPDAPAPQELLLDSLEELVHLRDERRLACFVLNVDSVLDADTEVLDSSFLEFYVNAAILSSLSKIRPLTAEQEIVFKATLKESLAFQTVEDKQDNYHQILLSAFKTAQQG